MKKLGWAVLAIAVGLVCSLSPGAGASGAQHYVIGTGADDGYQRYGYGVDATSSVMVLNRSGTPSERQSPMFRFENVQLGQGETVSSAVVTTYNNFGQYVDATWEVQAGGCSDLQVNADIYGRPVLPTTVYWYATFVRGPVQSPNIATVVNAATAQPTWHKGDSLCLILLADAVGIQRGFDPRAFESGYPPTLDLS